jgi:hypothetical protein
VLLFHAIAFLLTLFVFTNYPGQFKEYGLIGSFTIPQFGFGFTWVAGTAFLILCFIFVKLAERHYNFTESSHQKAKLVLNWILFANFYDAYGDALLVSVFLFSNTSFATLLALPSWLIELEAVPLVFMLGLIIGHYVMLRRKETMLSLFRRMQNMVVL